MTFPDTIRHRQPAWRLSGTSPLQISVSTLGQFDRTLERIREIAAADDRLLFFRGQTRRYFEPDGTDSLRPALCRPNRPVGDPRAREEVLAAFDQFLLAESARGAALPEFWAIPVTVTRQRGQISILNTTAYEKVPHTWVAVLQHYEVPTEMLDVTLDAYVALAFALWELTGGPPGSQPETGAVYVLGVPAGEGSKPSHVDLAPLFSWDGHLRPMRQKAALLSGLYDDPPAQRDHPNFYAGYVMAVVLLESCRALREELLSRRPELTEEHLFPSNREDRLYRFLLEAQPGPGSSRTFAVSHRKGNCAGLPLHDLLPAVEPLTGSLDVGVYGHIVRSRRFSGGRTEAALILNLYAGGSAEVLRAQEAVARLLEAFGRHRDLQAILCDHLEDGLPPAPWRQFDPAAFTWLRKFSHHLPSGVAILGLEDRRKAAAHTSAFQQAREIASGRQALLEALLVALSPLRKAAYPPEVRELDEAGTQFFERQQIQSWDLWAWFVRQLGAAAERHGIDLRPFPVFELFYRLYRMSPSADRTGRTMPPGAASKPVLTNAVGALLKSPDRAAEVGTSILRVLDHLALDRAVFETPFAGRPYINLARLQLYLAQHHGMDLVVSARDLHEQLLARTGGALGEVDLTLRVLDKLYRLELGFDAYLKLRSRWRRYGLRRVHAVAPYLFPAPPGWAERRRFDRERNRLFGLWQVVLRRYEHAARRACEVMRNRPGAYALVINGAYRPLFESALEEQQISYSTIQPRFHFVPPAREETW